MAVEIPGRSVKATATDISEPTRTLLSDLNLLPSADDLKQADGWAALTGPPDSVAILEAGATAASKWWSATIAGSAAVISARILTMWDRLGTGSPWNQPFALIAMGFVVAAAAIGVAFLLGSDVRGRAAGMVATIEARRAVAIAMVTQAGMASQPVVVPLSGIHASNVMKDKHNEDGWKAVAARVNGGETQFLLVKGDATEWVAQEHVRL